MNFVCKQNVSCHRMSCIVSFSASEKKWKLKIRQKDIQIQFD